MAIATEPSKRSSTVDAHSVQEDLSLCERIQRVKEDLQVARLTFAVAWPATDREKPIWGVMNDLEDATQMLLALKDGVHPAVEVGEVYRTALRLEAHVAGIRAAGGEDSRYDGGEVTPDKISKGDVVCGGIRILKTVAEDIYDLAEKLSHRHVFEKADRS